MGNNSVRAALGYPFLLQAGSGLGSMGFFVKNEQAASRSTVQTARTVCPTKPVALSARWSYKK
jgi:hypothetical protein